MSTEQSKLSVKERLALLKSQNDAKVQATQLSSGTTQTPDGGGMHNISRFMPAEVKLPDNFIQAQTRFPEFDAKQFATILFQLDAAIQAQAPGIVNYLQEISTNLLQFPELTHILTDEQLHIITAGLFFETDHNMATVISRSKTRELTIDEGRHLFS